MNNKMEQVTENKAYHNHVIFLKKASPVLSLHWAKCKSHDNSDHHTQHQRMHSVALSHSPLVLLQDALYSTMGTGLSASLTLFIADIKLPFYTT